MKQRQRGVTFLGMITFGAIVAFVGIMGAQVFPTYTEYLTIQKAVNKAAVGATVAEVRSIFDKAASVDYITSISGKDLEVTKQGEKVVVSFEYQREFHMGGPAYLVMKYKGASR
ncbi:MAG TPA: DUF4845 domain-containing protein [Burkholderiaceae bacterium]|nr:DUF4845 domain-containing protein [Burkholderiaceae bacterium]